jgi:phosphoribosyl 1,2-cyclic phosphodiesterase
VEDASDFWIRFWGVRGSIACPGPGHGRWGGNTACLEVRCGADLFVFDAGTGIRPLGKLLAGEGTDPIDLFLSHTHFDHVVGFPFFAPFYQTGRTVRVWAGHLGGGQSIYGTVCSMMRAPLFPVPPQVFTADVEFRDFAAGETIHPRPGFRLRTAPLNHPNGATAYRVDYAGRSVCYVTDTEHVPDRPDRNILDLVQGADVMIYDAAYTDEEFPGYVGWGHSTWQEGVRLADAAGVGRLLLFHHDPTHEDPDMDRIARAADAARPGTLPAYDGLVVRP